MVTVNVWRVEGAGSINVYSNNVLIGTVPEGGIGNKAFTFNYGDVAKFEAIASYGWSFQAFCDQNILPCPLGTVESPLTRQIIADGNVFVWFKPVQSVITVTRVAGQGSVQVYKNGVFEGNLTETEHVHDFYFLFGDSYSITANPASGFKFQKFCGDSACQITSTNNPLTGSINTLNGFVDVYFSADNTGCTTPSDYYLKIGYAPLGWGAADVTTDGITALANAINPILSPLGYQYIDYVLDHTNNNLTLHYTGCSPAIPAAMVVRWAIEILLSLGFLVISFAWLKGENAVNTYSNTQSDAVKQLGDSYSAGKITYDQYMQGLDAIKNLQLPQSTDWQTTAIYAGIILAAAYVLGKYIDKPSGSRSASGQSPVYVVK